LFSWKVSVKQHKYIVTKIELLAIVKKLKEIKGMLWGKPITVFTDHKHLRRDDPGLSFDQGSVPMEDTAGRV
jgi:hypothetical protein